MRLNLLYHLMMQLSTLLELNSLILQRDTLPLLIAVLNELLEQFNLESLEMVGTINKEGLWVLLSAPNSVVHRLTLGNYLGTNHGRITGISDERVDLIEIVPDGLGGWEQRESFLSLND